MRQSIVAGNWKMNKSIGESIDLAAEVKRRLAEVDGVEIVVCPPFTALKSVGDLLRYSNVKLGAQNMHWAAAGAYTGEVSWSMLQDLGCQYVILGHSERRTQFQESDADVNRKTRQALEAGLCPIVCVGETLEERDSGRTEDVLKAQVERCLGGMGQTLLGAVVAYEPVWAIGTGRTATADQAQAAHAFIRALVRRMAGDGVADSLRIQYGGSVKPENAVELLALQDVDGGLIGGAALDADSFVRIVEASVGGKR